MASKNVSDDAGNSEPDTGLIPKLRLDERPRGGGEGAPKRRGGPPLGSHNRRTHGLYSLKEAVKVLGSRTIDQRTKVGKALAAIRDDLLSDLGGSANLSRQEHLLIEETIITTLLLSSVNAWLLGQTTLVNKRSRSVIAAVRDRNALVLVLKGLLESLGLKRRANPLPSLAEILASGEPSPCAQSPQSSGLGSQPEKPAAASTEGTS